MRTRATLPGSFAVVAVAALATVTLAARQSPDLSVAAPSQETPTFRAGVEAVQVDAYVTDEHDRPVRGLTKDDFELFENGEPRPVTTFAPVDIPSARAPAPTIGAEPDVFTNDRPEGRTFLIILGAGVFPDNALRARHILRAFIETHFGDDDVAAVTVDQGLVTDGQDFTSNRRLILSAIDKYAGTVERRTGDEGSSARDLRDRMEVFARLPGHRKFVLWVTDAIGFDAYEAVDYHGGVPSLKGEYIHAAMAAATRGNIRIYPISPLGLDLETGRHELSRRMDFRALGEVTGGFAQVASNDFTGAFDRLIRETSTYYVLGFESSAPSRQGRYVRFEVKVKRPGLKVKARPGYVEQLDYLKRQTKPDVPRTPLAAAIATPVSVTGPPMRVVATPFSGGGRQAAVSLTVDIAPSALTFVTSGKDVSLDLELAYVATDARKGIHPQSTHTTRLALSPAEHQRALATGLRVVSQLDLPGGRYQVRVASAGGSTAGSVVADLEVPDFRKGALTMSGLSLASTTAPPVLTLHADSDRTSGKRATCRPPKCTPDVRSGATLVRWPTEGGPSVLDAVQRGLPSSATTRRSFAGRDTLAVFVEVYDNDRPSEKAAAREIVVTTTLHDATGAVVRRESDSRQASAARPSLPATHPFTMRIPLESLPAGAYVLQVEGRFAGDRTRSTSRRVPIRVE